MGEFDDEDGDGDENENGAGLKKDEQEGVGVGEGFGLSTDSADAAEVTATQKSGGGDVAAGDASASGTSSAAAQLDGPTAMDPPPLAEGAPAATGFFSKLSAKLTGGGAGARSSKAPGSAVASGKPPLGKPSNKTGGDGKPLKSNIRRISAPKPSAQAQARVETAAERPQSQQSEASSVDSGGFFKTAGLTEKQPAKTKVNNITFTSKIIGVFFVSLNLPCWKFQ